MKRKAIQGYRPQSVDISAIAAKINLLVGPAMLVCANMSAIEHRISVLLLDMFCCTWIAQWHALCSIGTSQGKASGGRQIPSRPSCGMTSSTSATLEGETLPPAPPPSIRQLSGSDEDGNMSLSTNHEGGLTVAVTHVGAKPVLRHAPTPRTVGFVEPCRRISGYSPQACTVLEADAITTDERARTGDQPEVNTILSSSTPVAAKPDTSDTCVLKDSSPWHHFRTHEPAQLEQGSHPRVTSEDETALRLSAAAKRRVPHDTRWAQGLSILWQRIWTPLGVLTSIYILLIIAWGSALFVMIIGWTSLPLMQRFQWIEICAQVSCQGNGCPHHDLSVLTTALSCRF